MGVTEAGVDLVVTGGTIWTENPLRPEAEAIAISGKHVSHVGSRAEILPLRGKQTRIIDLRGRRVVPGFNDAHVHFYYGGASLTGVQLRSAKSKEELRDRIAKFAASHPKSEWILLGEWDHETWTP